MSVKFVSAILGPEMAAPILWTPGKMPSFCRKTYVHKIPRSRGGILVWGEGGSVDSIFMGAGIFLNYWKIFIRGPWPYVQQIFLEGILVMVIFFLFPRTSFQRTMTICAATLRAKGTLISEPRFSTPCEMRFFPREKGKRPFSHGNFFEKGRFWK